MLRPIDLPLRCRLVSQTPIYDQLCDEQMNAGAPAIETAPEQVSHARQQLFPIGQMSPSAVLFSRSLVEMGAGRTRWTCLVGQEEVDSGPHWCEDREQLIHQRFTRDKR